MKLFIKKNYKDISTFAANYIAQKINDFNPSETKPFILGLPTGSTPVGTYKELIQLHRERRVSFKNVISFNMDEYVGIPETHPESYHSFMYKNFFDHIDIEPANINLLNGNADDPEKECKSFEDKIKSVGGIHLFLGGMGADGHIAFNVPGSSLNSTTRMVNLNYDTIVANSRFFDNDLNKVPRQALTVGVKTVMDANEVLILVNGYKKARALQKVVEEGINHIWTLSALQLHPRATIICDKDAILELKAGTIKYFSEGS